MIPVLLAAAFAAAPVNVELKTKTGTLHASLDLPTSPKPWPVVLLLAGSGPTDGDGNQAGLATDNLKMLGTELAKEGFAVLRPDKRGIGRSSAAMTNEVDIRPSHYAADAAEWVAFLRADGRFGKVCVAGHSEGSLFAARAGTAAKADAVISLCGPGRPFRTVLTEQLKKNLPAGDLPAAEAAMEEIRAGKPSANPLPASLAPLFRDSVRPYLTELFAVDPAKDLAAFPGPVLIVSGGTDSQVPAACFEALKKAKPAAKILHLPDMCHVLKTQPSVKPFDQLLTYMNREQPLHPKLVPGIAAFLRDTIPSR